MLGRAVAFRKHMQGRCTVRHSSDQPVPREIIEERLLAAGAASNGANLQPWHFVVVSNPKTKHESRVAVTEQWTHPLTIIGYLLGSLILLIMLAVFVSWKLPFIANDQQALLAIAILASLKVVTAVTHYLLARS
jgi:nitroreductase